MTLDALLAAGEAMHEALGREYYLTGSGQKREPAFQAIYDRYAALAGDAALDTARAGGVPAVLEWIVDVRVGRVVAPLEEAQLRWEHEAALDVDGRRVPYLRVPIELSNSPDRSYRLALDAARARAAADGLASLRRDRFQRERAALADMGWPDYVDGIATLSGIELAALGRDAAAYLDATDAAYADSLARLVRRRLDVPVDRLERADAPRLFRFDEVDGAFPGGRMVATAVAQMREMGLDATCGGRIRFDTEEREAKQPRAFCVPVRVPEEVYVVLRPQGGYGDYHTFWHELGHAMHFASVDPELPFPARRLGDNSVTEGFAMLWDHLTGNPGWLRRYTALDAGTIGHLGFDLAAQELFMTRRYAAKLCYELELHRSDLGPQVADRYVELLGRATRMRYLPEDALLDVDPAFYAARYLRAWQLEATLRDAIRDRYDEDWYRHPGAGAFVAALMARGQADTADRLALDAAGCPLDFRRVARNLEAMLD